MSKRAQRTLFLVLGFLLQVLGAVVIPEEGYVFTALDAVGLLLLLLGVSFWFYGFYLWASLKGRHWANIFWAFLTWIGVIVLALMEDRSRYRELSNEELQRCLVYSEEEWKLKAFQDKEAELYNNALVKCGNLIGLDSLASKEMCKAANRFAESAKEILKRRESIAKPPDLASSMYLKWQMTYSDYATWATAQCAAIEAASEGMVPNSQRVKELLSQSEKSRSQAVREEKKLVTGLRLGIDEVTKMFSDASTAIAVDNWRPKGRRKQARTKKEDNTSSERLGFIGQEFRIPNSLEELRGFAEQEEKREDKIVSRISKEPKIVEVLRAYGKKPEYVKDVRAKLVRSTAGTHVAESVVQNRGLLKQYLQMEADGVAPEEIAFKLLKSVQG